MLEAVLTGPRLSLVTLARFGQRIAVSDGAGV